MDCIDGANQKGRADALHRGFFGALVVLAGRPTATHIGMVILPVFHARVTDFFWGI
jgi:hypothetical protein